jgi:hypothetical protein
VVVPVLDTIVNAVELMTDDESALRRSDHGRPQCRRCRSCA